MIKKEVIIYFIAAIAVPSSEIFWLYVAYWFSLIGGWICLFVLQFTRKSGQDWKLWLGGLIAMVGTIISIIIIGYMHHVYHY
jgi:hypothetical protein